MNWPNILTVFRIFLTFFFLKFISLEGFFSKLIASGFFTLAALTDSLDGYLARKYQCITDFGKLMDPIEDKFLVLSAFYIFAQAHIISRWMFAVILIREVGITAFRIAMIRKGKVLAAENGGKIKTILQMIVVYIILIYMLVVEAHILSQSYSWWMTGINILMWLTVIVTVSSGLSFLSNNRKSLYVG